MNQKSLFGKWSKVLLLAIAALFVSCTDDLSSDVADLSDRLDALENVQLADLEDQVAALEAALEAAQDLIDENYEDLEKMISDLETEIDSRLDDVEADVSSLQSDVTSLETNVTTLQTNLAALQSTVDSLDDTYATDAELTAAVTTINTSIDAINTALSTLDDTYATDAELAAAVATINGEITTIKESITTINGRLDAIEDAIANLDETYATDAELAAEVTALTTKITANTDAITANTTNITTNATNIATNAADIVTLKSDMTDAETAIATLQDETSELYDLVKAAKAAAVAAQTDATAAKEAAATNLASIQTLTAQVSALEKAFGTYNEDGVFEVSEDFKETFTAQLEANKELINGWIGDYMSEYWNQYFTASLAEGSDEWEAFNDAVETVIENALGNEWKALASDVAALQTAVAALETKVAQLELDMEQAQSDIDDLEGYVADILAQLQTISYVPVNGDKTIDYTAVNIYKLDAYGVFADSAEAESMESNLVITMLYDIRPTTVAEAIAADWAAEESTGEYGISFENVTRSMALTSATVSNITLVDASKGRIKVEATINTVSAGDTIPALAFSVDHYSAADSAVSALSDYATMSEKPATSEAFAIGALAKLKTSTDEEGNTTFTGGISLCTSKTTQNYSYLRTSTLTLYENYVPVYYAVDELLIAAGEKVTTAATEKYFDYNEDGGYDGSAIISEIKADLGVDLSLYTPGSLSKYDYANYTKGTTVTYDADGYYNEADAVAAADEFFTVSKQTLKRTGLDLVIGNFAMASYTYAYGSTKETSPLYESKTTVSKETLEYTANPTSSYKWNYDTLLETDFRTISIPIKSLSDAVGSDNNLKAKNLTAEDYEKLAATFSSPDNYAYVDITTPYGNTYEFNFYFTYSAEAGALALNIYKWDYSKLAELFNYDETNEGVNTYSYEISASYDNYTAFVIDGEFTTIAYNPELAYSAGLKTLDFVYADPDADGDTQEYMSSTVVSASTFNKQFYTNYYDTFFPSDDAKEYFYDHIFDSVSQAITSNNPAAGSGLVKNDSYLANTYENSIPEVYIVANISSLDMIANTDVFSYEAEFAGDNSSSTVLPQAITLTVDGTLDVDMSNVFTGIIRNELYFLNGADPIYFTSNYVLDGGAIADPANITPNDNTVTKFSFNDISLDKAFLITKSYKGNDAYTILDQDELLPFGWNFSVDKTADSEYFTECYFSSTSDEGYLLSYYGTDEKTTVFTESLTYYGIELVDAFGDIDSFTAVVKDEERPISLDTDEVFSQTDFPVFDVTVTNDDFYISNNISLLDAIGQDIFNVTYDGTNDYWSTYYSTMTAYNVYRDTNFTNSNGFTKNLTVKFGDLVVTGNSAPYKVYTDLVNSQSIVTLDKSTGLVEFNEYNLGLAEECTVTIPITVSCAWYYETIDFTFEIK